MSSTRIQRMTKLLKEEISRIIREEINDPRLGFISITDIEMTPDLRVAHIHVSVYGTPAEQDDSIAVLERASRFLRGELGKQVEMRYTPVLQFHLDRSIERGARIFELLKETTETPQEASAAQKKDHEDEPS